MGALADQIMGVLADQIVGVLADQIVGDKGLKPLVFISRWGKLRINFGFSDIFLESQFNLSSVEFT